MADYKSRIVALLSDAWAVVVAWLIVGLIFRTINRAVPIGFLIFAFLFIFLPINWVVKTWRNRSLVKYWRSRACPQCKTRYQIDSMKNDSNVTTWTVDTGRSGSIKGFSIRCQTCGHEATYMRDGRQIDLKSLAIGS